MSLSTLPSRGKSNCSLHADDGRSATRAVHHGQATVGSSETRAQKNGLDAGLLDSNDRRRRTIAGRYPPGFTSTIRRIVSRIQSKSNDNILGPSSRATTKPSSPEVCDAAHLTGLRRMNGRNVYRPAPFERG
jgi:hypothetical protein